MLGECYDAIYARIHWNAFDLTFLIDKHATKNTLARCQQNTRRSVQRVNLKFKMKLIRMKTNVFNDVTHPGKGS